MPNPIRAMMIAFTGTLALLAAQDQAVTQGETPAFKLEAKIPIGDVSGRIDHMPSISPDNVFSLLNLATTPSELLTSTAGTSFGL